MKTYQCRYCLKNFPGGMIYPVKVKTKHFGVIFALVCKECREVIADHITDDEPTHDLARAQV